MQPVAKGNNMTKPWMKNYPENVAHEIDLSRYDSLLDLFHKTTTQYDQQTPTVTLALSLPSSKLTNFHVILPPTCKIN